MVAKKKRKAHLFRLQQLENESQLSNPFPEDEGIVVEGKIEDKIIISVPEDMTHSSLQQMLGKFYGLFDNELIITTHNIKFLRAIRVE